MRGDPREQRLVRALVLCASLVSGCATTPDFICPDGTEARWGRGRALDVLPDVESRVLVCVKPDGTQHGPSLAWLDRHLFVVHHWVDGQPDGTLVAFHENGRRHLVGDYRAGEIMDSVTWNAQGTKTYESVQGADGRSTTWSWYENGAPKSRVEWLGDQIHGEAEFWYESGGRRSRGHYVEGLRDGPWTCWDESGEHVVVAEYQDGEVVSRAGDVDNEAALALCTRTPCRCGTSDEKTAASSPRCGVPAVPALDD